ncbi:protein translocase subunit SecD [Caulobacter sp. SLTY]|uniref:protein translocase subunit SecD n=1 Tax=Caulobacter sp. SLTY TaxID=2683262 RepID=UPI001411E5E0|nr:protein translocase subunit SecD [Caulobacter sp. SLTY]NBB15027.1 protein translocase subunit SecD [Caulobacter sp. SLTY]
MMTVSRWKIIAVVAAVLLSLLFAMPNVLSQSARDSLPGFLPKKGLNLGLDLQGGSQLLLEVETSALRKERVTNLVEDVRRLTNEAGIQTANIAVAGDGVLVTLPDDSRAGEVQGIISRQLISPTKSGAADKIVSRNGAQVRVNFTDEAIREVSTNAVEQSIGIIARRVDELGTREPLINRQGENRIVVQAAGESDPEKLKSLIGQTAKLTFQMVDESVSLQQAEAEGVPAGSEILVSTDRYAPAYVVKKRADVTGEMLTDARQDTDPQTGQIVVSFRMNGEGARRFAAVTSANIGKPFAIILDGKVISAPNINSAITGGSGIITGNFTVQTANELAILLRAGALPAPLKVEQQSTVSASLGAEAVDAGLISTMIAFVSVLVFMVLAYGLLFGGISVIALVVNGMMIVAAMSMTQATLTLPGIAGLILTLAVAVDANVLIYERMRDEIRAGRTPLAAADAGFSRAMLTIFDANITHLGASLIMFSLGAGPVKGFAWTLAIGVFTSVFSAVLVTQVLLAFWFRVARPKKLPIT